MLKESQMKKIQEKIGYTFENPVLLSQAFTRKTWAVANGRKDNEVLEFFGDRILDFAATRDFFEQYGKINNKGEYASVRTVGELCKMESDLVKNAYLSEKITELGLTKHMQVKKAEEKCSAKVKGDLFEAILGAVAIDSGWNIAEIQQVYHAMMYSRGKGAAGTCDFCAEDENQEMLSAKDYIDLFETEIWKYDVFKTQNEYTAREKGSECHFLMNVNGKFCKVTGFGCTDHEAKISASERGYRIVRLVMEKELFADMRYTDQLYLLRNCGYASDFDFHYELYPHAAKGEDDLWRCFGSFRISENEFVAEDSTMSGAQEAAARAMLFEALEIDNPDEEQSYVTESNCESADDDIVSAETPAASRAKVIRGQGLLKLILSKYEEVA